MQSKDTESLLGAKSNFGYVMCKLLLFPINGDDICLTPYLTNEPFPQIGTYCICVKNAGQVGPRSSRPESSRPWSTWPVKISAWSHNK